MCGIAGWFDRTGRRTAERACVDAMSAAIAHRGPDGDGLLTAPGVALAHRRLAVIDLVSGEQPMWDVGGTAAIIFNGEIYNFAALKAELVALGHRFQTKSDTEVILEAWREWGEDCVQRLRGMFAFALWDKRQDLLFLARDRLGEKPLYYCTLPDQSFVFASELGALLAHPAMVRKIDPSAVEEFFALGYVAEPRTIYAAVAKLPAGCHMTLRRNQSPRIASYWNVCLSPAAHRDMSQAAAELVGRLGSSVAEQMVSDVPIGAFLSGGLDSSVTTALMARHSSEPVRCFTIGFSDPRFDESRFAAEVAARYGARHDIETLEGTETDLVGSLAGIFGEPFGDSSAIATLRLMRLARKHVTVALSGDGGDELFAGYRRYGFHAREEKLRGWLPKALRAPVFGALGRFYPQLDWAPRAFRARQTFLELSLDTVDGYFANISVMDDSLRDKLFSARLRRDLQGYRAREVVARHFSEAPFDDPTARAQYVDLKTWLPGDILTKVDRTAMACSLEVRVPMLDSRLVEWALNLPDRLKFAGGQGKAVLRQAARGLLPASLLSRPKQGFSVPLASWFRGAMGHAFERDLKADNGIAGSGTIDMDHMRLLLRQHRDGVRDHSRTLWLCWMFDRFLRDVHLPQPGLRPQPTGLDLVES
jgi:asparagine synthase (glutamine-hydrolysing)